VVSINYSELPANVANVRPMDCWTPG